MDFGFETGASDLGEDVSLFFVRDLDLHLF